MLKPSRSSQHLVCEQQAKFILDRITFVEKNFSELCTVLAAYTRKAARLRDKNDELAKVLKTYASSEKVNKSLSESLSNFSVILLSLGDFQDARVQKLDSKVIAEFSQYEVICKHAKEEVKCTFNARDKEIARKRQLDRLRERNPRNRQQISQAESELVKATAEVSRTIQSLEDQTDEFERQKSRNLKTILLDFISIEIGFHAKSLELLTKAYQSIDNVDEQADVEAFQKARGSLNTEFRSMLRMPERISRLETVKHMSFKNHSQSLGALNLKTPSPPLVAEEIKKPVSKSMESMDSYKITFEEETSDNATTTDDDFYPIPATRRIV